MNLQNIKSQKGFTIVELLIVIVVIGILAAIVIVAYNGVTSRANTSSAQGNAQAIQKVAETLNADTGAYPTAATNAAFNAGDTAKVPSGVSFGTPSSTNGTNTVSYTRYPATGTVTSGCIGYWDFTKGRLQFLGVGAATVNNTANPATCS